MYQWHLEHSRGRKCIKSRPSITFEDDTLVQNSSCSGQVGDACTIRC